MAISVRDRKLLWALSGNLCAFPGCQQRLTHEPVPGAYSTIVGEEAHIVAREPAGPRGQPRDGVTIDGYPNLVLLCPTHHRIIDDQPFVYSIQAIQAFKQAHEAFTRSLTPVVRVVEALDPSPFAPICGSQAISAWRIGSNTLVLCSFGTRPGAWVGSGLQFLRLFGEEPPRILFTSSEAEFDLEYWLEGSSLFIRQQTYNPDVNTLVPWVTHSFDLSTTAPTHSIQLSFHAANTLDTVSSVASDLRSLSPDRSHDAEVLLYRLRNVGASAPREALREVATLRDLPWYDGTNAETGTSVREELELLATFW